MADFFECIKETSAGHRFRVRFYANGNLLEWFAHEDESRGWEGQWRGGAAKFPFFRLLIGPYETEFQEGLTQGVEYQLDDEKGSSAISRVQLSETPKEFDDAVFGRWPKR